MKQTILCYAGLLCALATACGTRETTTPTTFSDTHVLFEPVQHGIPLSQTIHLTGDIHLMEDLTMPLYTIGGGRIEEVFVAEGDHARRGQTLATLRTTCHSATQVGRHATRAGHSNTPPAGSTGDG